MTSYVLYTVVVVGLVVGMDFIIVYSCFALFAPPQQPTQRKVRRKFIMTGGSNSVSTSVTGSPFYLSTFTDGDGAVPGTHDAVVVQLIVTEDLPLHQHDHGPTVDPKYAHYDRAGLHYIVSSDSENQISIQVDPVKPR